MQAGQLSTIHISNLLTKVKQIYEPSCLLFHEFIGQQHAVQCEGMSLPYGPCEQTYRFSTNHFHSPPMF